MRTFLRTPIPAAIAFATPLIAQAQNLQSTTSLISAFVNFGITILIGVAIIAFFWGLIRYVFSAKGGEEQQKSSKMMIYGILALFVMFSIYGLVRLLQNTFGVGGTQVVPAPQIEEKYIGTR